MREIASRSDFVAWLARQSNKRWFGRGACDCPLARYSECIVGASDYVTPTGQVYKLPPWAVTFVRQYDGLYWMQTRIGAGTLRESMRGAHFRAALEGT